MARDEVPAAVRRVDLRMTMRPRLCSPRSQGWFATSMAAIADRMRAAPSTPLEQEPEYKHHQAVEREDERGSSDVDPPDIRTYRLQPPGEAITRPRHEIVQQQHACDVADEQGDGEGERRAAGQERRLDERA